MAGSVEGTTPRQREFADRVRSRREELGLSQEALAHEAQINRTYIAALETGRRNSSLDLMGRLARALQCDLADLVHGLQDLPGRRDPGPARRAGRKTGERRFKRPSA